MTLLGFLAVGGLLVWIGRHLDELRGTGSAHGDWVRRYTGVHKRGKRRHWARAMWRWRRPRR